VGPFAGLTESNHLGVPPGRRFSDPLADDLPISDDDGADGWVGGGRSGCAAGEIEGAGRERGGSIRHRDPIMGWEASRRKSKS